ncbi:MAG: hypothetical protein K2N22_05585 [Clostridia bacterium]|nr:hypothetical protein [Clostridia bacterium]
MKKKIILCAALAAIACACASLAACGLFPKKKAEGPIDFTIGEVTDSSIEVVETVWADGEHYSCEFSLDGENWIRQSYDVKFSDLISNTWYTIYARAPGWSDILPSDTISKTVLTLRSVNDDLPEVDYTQERGKITLTGVTDEMEVSIDGGKSYSDISEYTYTKYGKYEIHVRYKQTDRAFASEAAVVNVEYSDFLGGLGTEEKPYLVSSYDELTLLDSGMKYYKLANDIEFPARECYPIKFTGNLDGNGKKFISPKIKNDETGSDNGAAIFDGYVYAKNLTVENAVCTVTRRGAEDSTLYYCGVLSSYAGEFVNCRVDGEIKINGAAGYYGGLAGYSQRARIQGCYAKVDFKYYGSQSGSTYELYLGGIIGYCLNAGGEISGCSTETTLFMTDSNVTTVNAGGIAGSRGNASFTGCSAKVNLTACALNFYLGGIAGCSDDLEDGRSITDCVASGSISAQKLPSAISTGKCCAGGILGGGRGGFSSTANIGSCISAVDISIDGTGLNVSCGGIIGDAYAYSGNGYTGKRTVENCLYAGTIAVNKDAAANNYIGAVWGWSSAAYETDNCFVKVQPSPDVDSSNATVVEEEVYLTAVWQRENLHLDESVWEITDGLLPKIKNA